MCGSGEVSSTGGEGREEEFKVQFRCLLSAGTVVGEEGERRWGRRRRRRRRRSERERQRSEV